MRFYCKRIFPLALLVLFFSTRHVPAQVSLDSLLQTLPETCESLMQKRGWPSLSVAVIHDQKIIFKEAFGYADIEKEKKATTETIYRSGSVTKVFVATMLMQLAERGVVGLEDPLDKYLPGYKPKSPYPGTRQTTLRQLASHTSGLPVDAAVNFWHYYSVFLWIVTNGQIDIKWYVPTDELLATLNTVEIEHVPNSYSNYSNFGFQLLGIAMERAVEQSIAEYMQSNILKPLGMESSCFELTGEQRSRLAVGYVYLEPDFDRYIAPEWNLGSAVYSGGLFSTPEDLARFLAVQFLDDGTDESGILSCDGIRRMRSPNSVPRPRTTESSGLGWGVYRIQDYQAIGHSGGHLGFSARIEALPELKLGIAVMTNARYPEGYIGPEKSVTRIILEKIIPAFKRRERETPFEPENIDLERYAGIYSVAGGYAEAEVKAASGKLNVTLIQDPEFNEPFLPVGRNSFCFESDPGRNPMLTFIEDDSGNIVGLEFLSNIFKKK